MDELIRLRYPIHQWQMTTNAISIDGAWDIVGKLVVEGIRVGKCPWSALSPAYDTAHNILSDIYNIKGKEGQVETIIRRYKEGPPCTS